MSHNDRHENHPDYLASGPDPGQNLRSDQIPYEVRLLIEAHRERQGVDGSSLGHMPYDVAMAIAELILPGVAERWYEPSQYPSADSPQ